MIVNAEALNKLRDSNLSLQVHYFEELIRIRDDIREYLRTHQLYELINYRGDYQETDTYHKFDIVLYTKDGDAECYMADFDGIPAGTPPTDTSYWSKMTLKGDAATIQSVRVKTLVPGSDATVVNKGTNRDAVFEFGIPRGDPGLGDMTTTDYDKKRNGIVDNSERLGGEPPPAYALSSHTHENYALKNHSHSNYASVGHSHSNYASVNHTHRGYASDSHTHAVYSKDYWLITASGAWRPPKPGTYKIHAVGKGGNGGSGQAHATNIGTGGGGGGGGSPIANQNATGGTGGPGCVLNVRES